MNIPATQCPSSEIEVQHDVKNITVGKDENRMPVDFVCTYRLSALPGKYIELTIENFKVGCLRKHDQLIHSLVQIARLILHLSFVLAFEAFILMLIWGFCWIDWFLVIAVGEFGKPRFQANHGRRKKQKDACSSSSEVEGCTGHPECQNPSKWCMHRQINSQCSMGYALWVSRFRQNLGVRSQMEIMDHE